MNKSPEYVWLTDERTYAELVSLGAYVSRVRYTRGGIDFEVLIDNDEFEYKEVSDVDGDED